MLDKRESHLKDPFKAERKALRKSFNKKNLLLRVLLVNQNVREIGSSKLPSTSINHFKALLQWQIIMVVSLKEKCLSGECYWVAEIDNQGNVVEMRNLRLEQIKIRCGQNAGFVRVKKRIAAIHSKVFQMRNWGVSKKINLWPFFLACLFFLYQKPDLSGTEMTTHGTLEKVNSTKMLISPNLQNGHRNCMQKLHCIE